MRTRALRVAAIALVVALLAPAAPGQTIFRCGDSYSRSSCADARVIEGAVPVTAAQQAEAHDVAARERLLALEMVRDRRERERAIRPATAGSLGPAPRGASLAPAPKKHPRAKKRAAAAEDDRDFVAAVPRTKR